MFRIQVFWNFMVSVRVAEISEENPAPPFISGVPGSNIGMGIF